MAAEVKGLAYVIAVCGLGVFAMLGVPALIHFAPSALEGFQIAVVAIFGTALAAVLLGCADSGVNDP